MSNGSGDIIIKGDSSVEVEFDGSVYTPEGKKHKNKDMKLTRVVVTDEGGGVKFDSGEDNRGLKWTIRAFAK
ncbi:MAG: hypothetical protein ACRD8U_10275 [Pyrinomonadaceae bacterium]